MSQQIKELFSSIAPTYDRLNHLLSINSDKRWRRKTIGAIRADSKAPLYALDLCAGTLDLSLEFLNRFKNATCFAVDFSEAMLEKGRQKIPDDAKNRIFLHCADALKLPFSAGQFDLIFCGYGFRNLDDPVTGLCEIRRVLKEKGQLLLLEFFRPTRWKTKLFHQSYGQIILPFIGRLVSGRAKAYDYLHNSIGNFYSTDECKKVLENHGFINIDEKNFFMGVSSLIVGYKM